ncbi:MAG: ABC transporter permease [Bauldia sp.]|nr:ABC transporter permease [Bauldia sp.]
MTSVAVADSLSTRRTGSLAKTMDEVRALVWRNLSHIPRMPERLADVTVMPVMFVILFGYVFGSAIVIPGMEMSPESSAAYREFLIGGIFVQSVVFMCITTAVGVVNDMKEGVIDRFRSLPISRVSVLLGRAIASLVEGSLGIFVMAICGLIVGWGAHNGFGNAVAAFALLAGIAFAMICIGIFVGQLVKNPMSAQAIGFTLIFPLTFASNAFVPTDNMPGPLKVFSEWNPVSAMVQAVRELFGNLPPGTPVPDAWPLQNPVLATVIWIVVFAVIGMTLAVRKYARGRDQ